DQCKLAGNDSDSIEWRNENLPLARLRNLLMEPAPGKKQDDDQVLVCRFSEDGSEATGKHHAIAVEAVEGTQEVLVRSLGQHSAMWPGIVGATELWDGTVALVLDLPLLLSLHSR